MTAISLIAPGFSQLYNKQAWKIPILYGVNRRFGLSGFSAKQQIQGDQKRVQLTGQPNAAQEQLDPVQCEMIRYNTGERYFSSGRSPLTSTSSVTVC